MENPFSILQLLATSRTKDHHPVCAEIEMKSTTNMKQEAVSTTTITTSSTTIENNDIETSMPLANNNTNDDTMPPSPSSSSSRRSSRRWGSSRSSSNRNKMMIWGTLDDDNETTNNNNDNILVGKNSRSLVSRDDDIIAMMDTKHTKLNSSNSASNSRISRHMQKLEERKRKLERSSTKQQPLPKLQDIKKTKEGTIDKDNNSWWNYNPFSVFTSNIMTDDVERQQNHHENNDGIFRDRIDQQRRKGYRPHSLSFDSDVVYTALEQEGYQKSSSNNNIVVVTALDDTITSPSSTSINDPLFATNKETSLAQQIQNSCSFFYTSSNNQALVPSPLESTSSHYNHPWRSIVRPTDYDHHASSSARQRHQHQDHQYYNTQNHRPFDYTDAVTILSPPVLQQYRIRYEQLNRPNPSYDDDGDSDDDDDNILNANHSRMINDHTDPHDSSYNIHDLYLTLSDDNEDENEQIKTTTAANDTNTKKKHHSRRKNSDTSYTTDTVEVSSLFYKANGRLLMRLPRDRVRLLQDPDLEPGVLSVDEQWNKKSSDNNTLSSPSSPFIKNVQQQNHHHVQQQPLPLLEELHYALTVPDDIYRKVVSEMSYRYSDPLGLYFCCSTTEYTNSNERVDIRVAIWLLILLFLILLFITIYYRED